MSTTTRSGDVRLKDVSIRYDDRLIIDRISLDIRAGQFVCLLGPSGCGKTTTLRAIAGLVSVDSGDIYVNGRIANNVPSHRRGTAMVFQDLALFPHMTVVDNIAFGLTLQKLKKEEIRSRVAAMLNLLRLQGLGERYPKQLSGGQQQRVALARALVVQPAVILLDEPFAALDRKLREEMRREIRDLQRKVSITALFVTHDQEEALTMSDVVVVMNQGRLEQVGTPAEVYETPASRFVFGFVGTANFLRVGDLLRQQDGVSCTLAGSIVHVHDSGLRNSGGAVELAIRPERLRLLPADSDVAAINRVSATVRDIRYEGASTTYDAVLSDGQPIMVRVQMQGGDAGQLRFAIGDPVLLAWGARDAAICDACSTS